VAVRRRSPLRSFLDRFRRGAAASVPPAGEPAGAGPEAELAPLFAALDDLEREAAAVRREAAERARQRVESARADAARMSASWRERAEAERLRAVAEHRGRTRDEAQAIVAGGVAVAERVRARGEARLDELVAVVVGRVREAAT
jgi:vacuolar-type H+-ATPase subunit H